MLSEQNDLQARTEEQLLESQKKHKLAINSAEAGTLELKKILLTLLDCPNSQFQSLISTCLSGFILPSPIVDRASKS